MLAKSHFPRCYAFLAFWELNIKYRGSDLQQTWEITAAVQVKGLTLTWTLRTKLSEKNEAKQNKTKPKQNPKDPSPNKPDKLLLSCQFWNSFKFNVFLPSSPPQGGKLPTDFMLLSNMYEQPKGRWLMVISIQRWNTHIKNLQEQIDTEPLKLIKSL